MSGGVNVKSAPRAPVSTGIPLPRSLLPSSPKAEPHRQASGLPRPSRQAAKHTAAHTPTQTLAHSPKASPRRSALPAPPSRDLLRDATLRNQLLQRVGAPPIPQVSRSAYSSPQTQRKEPPRSRDTLDLDQPAAAYVPPYTHASQNGNRNRNAFTNRNQHWGASNLRPLPELQTGRGDNSNTLTLETGPLPGEEEQGENP
ncbi:uncharacterized protein FYW47_001722, partial [Aplochiton taeniatus]